MPPQKTITDDEDGPPRPCVRVLVEIEEARGLYEQNSNADKDVSPSQPPDMFVSWCILGEKRDSRDKPILAEEPLLYKFNISNAIERPLKENTKAELIRDFLNSDLTITLHRCDTGMAVATGSMPLDEFMLGVHTVEKKKIQLSRVSPSSKTDPYQVTDKGSLWTRVSLLCDEILEKDPETGVILDAHTTVQHPYQLVPQNEVAKSCVVEFSISSAGPLPQMLRDVVAQLPEGTLSFSVGLGLDSRDEAMTEALILNGGLLEDDGIKWAKSKKFFLPAATVRRLREMMEDGEKLRLELARYVSLDAEGFTDAAFQAYHAYAHVNISEQFMVPGATDALGVAASFSITGDGDKDESTHATVMPPPVQNPNPKAKQIEAAPEAMKKFSPWLETKVNFKLTLSKPLVPPWQPPPKPSKQFDEVIPKRLRKKALEPQSATMEFKAQIQSLMEFLKEEYEKLHFEGTEAMKQKKLVFELNQSGKYLGIQTHMKKYLEDVIQERYKTKDNMSKEGLAGLYNDIYVHLLDSARDAIKPAESPAPVPPVPDQLDLDRLLYLANEYEIAGNKKGAEQKHQDRIAVCEDPEVIDEANAAAMPILAQSSMEIAQEDNIYSNTVWHDYGRFCMRCGMHGRAEECFRESISLDPCNVECLQSLSGLMLHNGIMTDPKFLEDAEIFLHRAREIEPDNATVWALLGLVVEGVYNKDDLRNIHFEVARLGKKAIEGGGCPSQSDGFLTASGLLLDMNLPECSKQGLAFVKESRDPVDAATIQLGFNRAMCAHLQHHDSQAVDILKATIRLASEEDIRGYLLMGKILFEAGRLSEACDIYQHGLRIDPAAFTLQAFIHLGACYSAKLDWQSACDVLLQGCISHASMTLWQGVGVAYLRLGDFHKGELALSEANILDSRNADVWGYLALIALKEQRFDEASMALSRAHEEGLSDVDLIMELGQACSAQGRYQEAEAILRRLLAINVTSKVHELLGCALWEQNKHEEAKHNFCKALEDEDVDVASRIALLERTIQVNKSLGYVEEAERLEVELVELSAGKVQDNEEGRKYDEQDIQQEYLNVRES